MLLIGARVIIVFEVALDPAPIRGLRLLEDHYLEAVNSKDGRTHLYLPLYFNVIVFVFGVDGEKGFIVYFHAKC